MAEAIKEVRVSAIDPDPANPRGQLTDEDPGVQEFAQQLKEKPVIYQPLRLLRDGKRFQIVIGERRWRAARLAGLKTVPAIVEDGLSELDVKDQQLAEMSQQNEVPTHRQYEAWSGHVRTLIDSGVSRGEALRRVAKLVGKSERTVSTSIGAGYVGAPKELKRLVEAGKLGPSVVSLLNAGGLRPADRVKLGRKIANDVIPTTGTTIQSQLMPLIRKGGQTADQLINNPDFTLKDALRLEQAKELAVQEEERTEKLKRAKEHERERPRTMGEVSFDLEQVFLDVTSKLRSLNELEMVPHLNVKYLRAALRLFDEQWEAFKAQLDPSVLQGRGQSRQLTSGRRR